MKSLFQKQVCFSKAISHTYLKFSKIVCSLKEYYDESLYCGELMYLCACFLC